jgi:hypothetical protein
MLLFLRVCASSAPDMPGMAWSVMRSSISACASIRASASLADAEASIAPHRPFGMLHSDRSERKASFRPGARLSWNAYHMPPRATVIASPFTPPAASLHRNAITCATSIGSSTRFCG